jgi:hypothetical protein
MGWCQSGASFGAIEAAQLNRRAVAAKRRLSRAVFVLDAHNVGASQLGDALSRRFFEINHRRKACLAKLEFS